MESIQQGNPSVTIVRRLNSMSYEIEYSKHALKAKNKYNDDVFFTYVKICSNNVSPWPSLEHHSAGL